MDGGIYEGIWQYKPLMGFETGNKYVIKVEKPPNSCYNIEELEERLCIQCASEISIKKYFKNLRRID